MKKFLSLALAVVMLLGMVVVAQAEEAPTSSTAWLLYFASNHEKDSANFPWWPQRQRVDQPASETGVEFTNAQVTGPGKYTVGLKFNWQKAEGAIQMNLILDDAEVLFPGYYVDITDIRVNGVSIDVKENMYGVYHDDPDSGMVSIYNSYWDPFFTPDATGPNGHRAFDGTVEDASYLIINPDDIVAGDTLEVDFIFAAEAGAAPEELGDMPYVVPGLVEGEKAPLPADATTAWLFYQAGGWWPDCTTATGNSLSAQTPVTITGEGYYTASFSFVDQGGWTPAGDGAQKLHLVVEDGADKLSGYYLNVTDIRVNGQSIDVGAVGFGQVGYDAGHAQANDSYAIIYDQWQVDNTTGLPWGHETWDAAAEGTCGAINPADIAGAKTIEVDFFLSTQQNVEPPKGEAAPEVWYNSNTVGLAGLSLKDLGIADDWHNIVPVDLTKTGWQRFPLVGADAHEIGNAYVAVNNGAVSVTFDYAGGSTAMLIEHSECIKWFTDLSAITAEELASTEGGLTSADAVNVQNDLGGASVAYLSINNKISWRSPIDNAGNNLPRYWRNAPSWVAYREELMALMPADAE